MGSVSPSTDTTSSPALSTCTSTGSRALTPQAGDAVSSIAARLTRYGVTAFCPTTVACSPEALRRVLEQVRRAREAPALGAARVLPAHLESNFINPEYKGAQPAACLRSPRAALDAWTHGNAPTERGHSGLPFEAGHILREIERAAPDVGIVTLAPELDGGLDLIAWLLSRGHRVSLGHSAATYDKPCRLSRGGAARRTCSIACRRLGIARRASPAPYSKPRRSPRVSSATVFTSTRRSCAPRLPPKVLPGCLRSPTAQRRPGCRPAVPFRSATKPFPSGKRPRFSATAPWQAAC